MERVQWMREYLWFSLSQCGLDADNYTDYFLSLLDTALAEGDGDPQKSEFLRQILQFLEACGMPSEDADTCVREWSSLCVRGALSQEESEWVAQQYELYAQSYPSGAWTDGTELAADKPQEPQELQELISEIKREPVHETDSSPLSDFTQEELQLLHEHFIFDTDNAHTETESEREEEETDMESELEREIEREREIDWLAVVDDVESILREKHSHSLSFSPSALFSALSISTEQDPAYAAKLLVHTAERLNAFKPCRHALAGKCLRRDCAFDHDFSLCVCRYWLYSTCSGVSGDCPFSHFLSVCEKDVERKKEKIVIEQDNKTRKTNGNKSATTTTSRDRESEKEKERARSSFPSLAESAVRTQSKKQQRSYSAVSRGAERAAPSTWVSAVKKSADTHTDRSQSTSSSHSAVRQSESSSVTQRLGFLEMLASHDFVTRKESGRSTQLVRGAVRVDEWVESGSVVKQDYEELRREARDFAITRAKFFQEATTAYLNGAAATARALSQQGRVAQQEMERLHQNAAKTLFRRRNSPVSLCGGQVDLHGLHVSEALACLDELLPVFRDARFSSVKIVTGSGHHTVCAHTGKSRLHFAVNDYLQKETRYRVDDIRDQQGYKGGFLVHLSVY